MSIEYTPEDFKTHHLDLNLKVNEKHVNQHLMGYLNKLRLIHESQSGFKQKHKCQTALVKLIDQWLTCMDKGDINGTLFIDFHKAFDLVDHSILITNSAPCLLDGSSHTCHFVNKQLHVTLPAFLNSLM